MNACTFCKQGKRKCSKDRPSCANCLRLGRACVYTEDTIQTYFADEPRSGHIHSEIRKLSLLSFTDLSSTVDTTSHETLQKSTVDLVMRTFGSLDNIIATSTEFFTGTHQRISAISKLRFDRKLQTLTTRPCGDFAALCLSVLLIQQMPRGKMRDMLSPFYFSVKHLIGVLETSNGLSLDLLHCRILVTFYEMGHAIHAAAYISVAACARTARALGLHRNTWRNVGATDDKIAMEERKRIWWAITIMEKFISLCNGDPLFVMEDPERTDPLPIEDLLWSEASVPADLEDLIAEPPSLDTPFNIRVGQMARECQISHLVGRVVQHVFAPTPDPIFNAKEAAQLERTLKAYLPLLENEELKIGKYCGAFGVCNSSLFVLYEFLLLHSTGDITERQQILQSIEKTSLRAIKFAEASYKDREENYPFEIISPYLPYSLCQSGIVQYRLWRQTGDSSHKRHLDSLKSILADFTRRWTVASQYLEIIENLNERWPPIAVPFQGSFISSNERTLI